MSESYSKHVNLSILKQSTRIKNLFLAHIIIKRFCDLPVLEGLLKIELKFN